MEIRVSVGLRILLFHTDQTDNGAHPDTYPIGKEARPKADHSPSTTAEVKITWIVTSAPPYVFMV
jgi:hypothetical protein